MPRGDRAFREVTPKEPCQVCGGKGWCRRSADGSVALCRRESAGGVGKVDRAGVPYNIHRIGSGTPGQARPVPPSPPPGPTPTIAPVDLRDRVYRAVLEALPLSEAHRRALVDVRRFPPAEVDRRGYGTLPDLARTRWDVAGELADRFGADLLATIPGVRLAESTRTGRPFWTLTFPPGLLIPVRDLEGRIAAMLVRPDATREGGGKYLWATSAPWGGPGPGDAPDGLPAHAPLPMPGGTDPRGGTVAVVEGILKADLAASLDPARLPHVGIPGHSLWRSALPVLRAMGPRTVRYYPDPDAWDKAQVGASLRAFWHALKSAGFTPELARFNDAA